MEDFFLFTHHEQYKFLKLQHYKCNTSMKDRILSKTVFFRILRYTNKHLPIFSQVFPWALVFCEVFVIGQPLPFYVNMHFTPSKYQHSKHFDSLKCQLRTFYSDLPHVKYIYFTVIYDVYILLNNPAPVPRTSFAVIIFHDLVDLRSSTELLSVEII
jgi:hypothetical protein